MQQETSSLLTEQSNGRSRHLDQLSVGEIIRLMNEEDQTVALRVKEALPHIERAIEQIVARLENGGKLYYFGAGSSGRIGSLDATECPPTFGVDRELFNAVIAGGQEAMFQAVEDAEDDVEVGKLDARERLSDKDVFVGLAASGTTPYVLGAIREAKQIGALTVAIVCNVGTPLGEEADYPIEIQVGPEIIAGSTRLKAGTSQKMVVNMISSTVMIRLGKVYRNLMVNVQATNEKLRNRVVNMVMQAIEVDEGTAQGLVQQANGDARIAILMHKFGLPPEEIDERLTACYGHFGHTLQQLEQQYRLLP
jgi:N-acetylmuramic acid 6-phosphate etherase